MPKSEVTADVPGELTASAPDSFDLTIDEFCVRLSSEGVAPELIGGFYHDEKANGRVKDSDSGYRGRFAVFGNQPA